MSRIKFVVGIILAVVLLFTFSSNCFAGGGTLSDWDKYQIGRELKKMITRISLFFYNVNTPNNYSPDYNFQVELVGSKASARFEGLSVGTYDVNASAEDNQGRQLFTGNNRVTVRPLPTLPAKLLIVMKMADGFFYRINVSLGEESVDFEENQPYEVQVRRGDNTIYTNTGWYQNGVLSFGAELPFDFTNGDVVIKDKNGDYHVSTINANTLSSLANNGTIQADFTAPPTASSGEVKVFFTFQHENFVPQNGQLIKPEGMELYYYFYNGQRYKIPEDFPGTLGYKAAIMESWGWTNDQVIALPLEKLVNYQLAGNVTIRPGTFLVKNVSDSKIYAVEYRRNLRQISEEALPLIYGQNRADLVITIPDPYFTHYRISSQEPIGVVEKDNGFIKYKAPSDLPIGSVIGISTDEGDGGLLVGYFHLRQITKQGLIANKIKAKFSISDINWAYNIADNNPINSYAPELDFMSEYVNLDTLDLIDGGLGAGIEVSYGWLEKDGGLPANVKLGDVLEFTYDDGTLRQTATAEVKKVDIAVCPSCLVEYYCQVPWAAYLPFYGSTQNYKVRVVQ